MINLGNKAELAFLSYLFLYGGVVPQGLLTDAQGNPAGLFDNPGWFAENPVAVRALAPAWVGVDSDPFAGMTWYPGHCGIAMDALPRTIITAPQAGGDGLNSGYADIAMEILIVSAGTDAAGQAKRHAAMFDLLQQGQLRLIQRVLNAPAEGEDTRAVQNFGLDSLVFRDYLEGRDETNNRHGVKFMIDVGVHAEGPGLI